MSSKSKILFLMPSLRGGGAERTLINLLQKINYNRYEIDLIVVSKFGTYVDQVPLEVNVTYLFKNQFPARIFGYLHRTFDWNSYFIKQMQKLEKEYDVGISFLDTHYTNLLFYSERIKRRVAFIHSSYRTHDNYERFYRHDKYQKKLLENRYSKLDAIYFVSDDSKQEFIEVFDEYPNMGIIYNMIDTEAVELKSVEDTAIVPGNGFSMCAVGSLIPVKGFDRLLKAAGLVKQAGYDFELHLVGEGPEEENLKSLAEKLELDSRVVFHGFLSNPYPIMKQCDLFVMSSLSEALPTVLCEAMILGKPTLVTNCSGCRGLVQNGEIGMIAEQNKEDLSRKMIKYITDQSLLEYYSEKSVRRAKLFDDERILQQYYDIFDGK